MMKTSRTATRREFLQQLLFTAGCLPTVGSLVACSPAQRGPGGVAGTSPFGTLGPLLAPNEIGVQLPAGFSARILAVAGQPPLPSKPEFLWHTDPDGGGIFATEDGGWIYVSNAEVRDSTTDGVPRELALLTETFGGGVNALRFDAQGQLIDAYNCQSGTTTNCSGGVTPWGTWINGEEIGDGFMFECSPLRDGGPPQRLDRFGRKGHEMAAVDERGRAIYHTEDYGDFDRFYRTVFSDQAWPAGGRPDMSQGQLQVLQVPAGLDAARRGPAPINWIDAVDDGQPQQDVANKLDTTLFDGNEGCWYLQGFVFFTTKSDDTIWAIDVEQSTIESVYDPTDGPIGSPVDASEPPLMGVDNIAMTLDGEMLVVEDGGDMRCMVLLPDRTTVPLFRLPGDPQLTEVTGVAIAPPGDRIYVSGQRSLPDGSGTDFGGGGVTYEIRMPFAVRVAPPLAGRIQGPVGRTGKVSSAPGRVRRSVASCANMVGTSSAPTSPSSLASISGLIVIAKS